MLAGRRPVEKAATPRVSVRSAGRPSLSPIRRTRGTTVSWSYNSSSTAWACTEYADLNYVEINNLAEYGQPFSPYETGYVHSFVPDFGHVAVEMTQQEVMTNGYGKDITVASFSGIDKFLLFGNTLPQGNLTFDDLVTRRFFEPGWRTITGSLYHWNPFKLPAGKISSGDAAYIHGSVGFALMKAGTRFVNAAGGRRVEAEIGALDDNWDFESGNVFAQALNGIVAAVLGPDHYNLTGPIKIRFTGPGKRSTRTQAVAQREWDALQAQSRGMMMR